MKKLKASFLYSVSGFFCPYARQRIESLKKEIFFVTRRYINGNNDDFDINGITYGSHPSTPVFESL